MDNFDDYFDKTTAGGVAYYNLWYNEQRSRAFTIRDKDLSYDACFKRVHEYIVSDTNFIKWCKRYQQGKVAYVAGSQGASVLPITYILNNYVKSLMGLPFYKFGQFEEWKNSKSDIVKEIAAFSISSRTDRYMIMRKMMTDALLPALSDVYCRDLLINALITVFYSETGAQIFLHNSYPNFNKNFTSEAKLSSLGQPNSTAFGLGQWLGNRLLDYYYFVTDKVSLLTDPRKIGPEILYHPSFQVAFMAFELRKGGYYQKTLVRQLNKWKQRGKIPSYREMVELVLEFLQGIKPTDSQFAAKSKIINEKKVVDGIPANFSVSFNLTKLL
jgi:hypothetical protein